MAFLDLRWRQAGFFDHAPGAVVAPAHVDGAALGAAGAPGLQQSVLPADDPVAVQRLLAQAVGQQRDTVLVVQRGLQDLDIDLLDAGARRQPASGRIEPGGLAFDAQYGLAGVAVQVGGQALGQQTPV